MATKRDLMDRIAALEDAVDAAREALENFDFAGARAALDAVEEGDTEEEEPEDE